MKIAILDDYQNVALELGPWNTLPPTMEVVVFNDHISSRERLAAALRPFDVVCLMRERTVFDAELIAALPDLKLIVTAGAKNAAIDLAAARSRGIVVSGTRRSGRAAAELAVTFMLALARNLVWEIDSVRSGGWQCGVGMDIEGATLGIVGLGNLGSQVAKMALGLGMDVVAWSPNLDHAHAASLGVTPVDKETLFRSADFVSLHLVLSDRSRHTVSRADLARMKSSAFLVNTSRAGLVDEVALMEALNEGRIAGVATDVFTAEPLPQDSPFRNHPKVLATPHIGYVTDRAYRTFYEDFVEDILAFAGGRPVRQL